MGKAKCVFSYFLFSYLKVTVVVTHGFCYLTHLLDSSFREDERVVLVLSLYADKIPYSTVAISKFVNNIFSYIVDFSHMYVVCLVKAIYFLLWQYSFGRTLF